MATEEPDEAPPDDVQPRAAFLESSCALPVPAPLFLLLFFPALMLDVPICIVTVTDYTNT